VPEDTGPTGVPFVFHIAAGVRHGDTTLQARLDRVLQARRSDIEAILSRYGVPLAGKEPT